MRRVTTTRMTTSRSRTNPVMLLSRRRWRWRCLRVAGNDGTGGRVDETEEGDKRERDMTCGPGRSGRGKGVTGRAGHRRRRRLTLDRAGTGCNGARCAPGNLKCRAGDQVCRTQVLREGGTATKGARDQVPDMPSPPGTTEGGNECDETVLQYQRGKV